MKKNPFFWTAVGLTAILVAEYVWDIPTTGQFFWACVTAVAWGASIGWSTARASSIVNGVNGDVITYEVVDQDTREVLYTTRDANAAHRVHDSSNERGRPVFLRSI